VFNRHLPYFESDLSLKVEYNIRNGGRRLDYVTIRRNAEVFLNAWRAERLPGATTECDSCRRSPDAPIQQCPLAEKAPAPVMSYYKAPSRVVARLGSDQICRCTHAMIARDWGTTLCQSYFVDGFVIRSTALRMKRPSVRAVASAYSNLLPMWRYLLGD
jgi:hypothetical protein